MQPPDVLPATWQRLLALSGVVFAILCLIGWFASGGDAPDYAAADQEWIEWADDNQWRSRVGAFSMLRNFLSSDQDSPQLRSFRRPISLLPNMAPVDGAVFPIATS